ncbi:MAG: hypothetical protein IJE15_09910 [Bacteroidaceae bacterium]|nr:hypothetical protein [Bacteroidaceae bacterium]
MNREDLLSAVVTLTEDTSSPMEQHIARETIYDFIGSITDEDTQEVVDQLCVECMDETKKSRAAAQLSEYIRILVPE